MNLNTGAVETLYTHAGDTPLHGPNDIVFDEDGGFWFTDFGKTFEDRIMRGAVYYARTEGAFIRRAAHPLLTPNGVGLSPDGRTLYVTETETSRLWSYPIVGPGELAHEPWPSPNGGKLVHGLPGFQRFDSLAVEAAEGAATSAWPRWCAVASACFRRPVSGSNSTRRPRATAPTCVSAGPTVARPSSRCRATGNFSPRAGRVPG